MSIQRFCRFLPAAAIASLMITILLGGCPVAQQPTASEDEQDQLEAPGTTEPDGDLDRPIPPPNLDGDDGDDQDDSDGGDTTTPGGSTGGEEDDGGPGFVSVTIDEPAGNLATRLGTVVNVEFAIFDSQGALVSVKFVVARDNDGDHQPDGSPLSQKALTFQAGNNTYSFNTTQAKDWLTNKFGRFLLGISYKTVDGQEKVAYAPGSLSIDSQAPTGQWLSPAEDMLVSRSTQLNVRLSTTDNRPVTVKVLLDPDLTPGNGGDWTLIPETELSAGTNVLLEKNVNVQIFPAGSYYYYVTVSDGIDPAFGFYAETQGSYRRLGLTDRLVGDFDLNQLTNSNQGAILQGFNFNDLAGSSMASVPDLNGDGNSELIVGARFGKPNLNFFEGRGWGEAYLIYGDGNTRLKGQQTVNSVGASIPGLTFRGIRVPLCESNYTEGLSDITVIDDMDGDDLPELVFSFPRVESLNLGAPATVGLNAFQHPELLVDEATASAGTLEYDAIDYMGSSWTPNQAQFTRGGIVIVSSHNDVLTDREQVTRKFDRVLDLHEIGQLFTWMNRPSPWPYILDISLDPNDPFGCFDCIPQDPNGCECVDTDPNVPECEVGCGSCFGSEEQPEETEYYKWIVTWDVWLGGS